MNAKAQDLCGVAFVVMSYGAKASKATPTSREVYDCTIKPAAENKGLRCVRADEIVSPGSIPQQIRYYVKNSEVVIADITGHNLNVFYEVGIRHGANGKAILLVRDIDDVPSDLKSDRVIVYDLATPRGLTKARRDLEGMLDDVLGTA